MAFNNKIFDTPEYMENVGYAKRRINDVAEVLEQYDDDDSLLSLDDDELLSVLSNLEKTDVSFRSAMEELDWNGSDSNRNVDNIAYKNMNVDVTFQNDVLKIASQLTMDRNYKDAHYLGKCVKVGFEKYKAVHGDNSLWHKIHSPYYMMMVRYTPASRRTRFRDNDHTEDANIINTVAAELGLSDKPTDMGYISVTLHVKSNDEARVEFYFFSGNKLAEAISWLSLKQSISIKK